LHIDRENKMPDKEVDATAFVELAAALNGIEITPDQRPGVIMNFENFRALQRRIMAGDAPNPLDPLGLFRP
jgi:hypothetical protein